ncbi:uncharacterized protein Z518_10871 [Rhinocladiella mackenziei CBS 650.93]|uniref:N-acetyltransferase domain-containing protein n=1 Tax=Rhinocladiella mackenziei CBS 650.93 TaxID=1442369 RepID=A0A0D2I2H4_9EURO|nr:uncharacterized protein Z518_10871 [Rhinocladiella mackenziei CBS 650.93]KIW99943.1 hypothetical protein Z518_10871 [Rhinocladiella mackenziei CBS 650.93]
MTLPAAQSDGIPQTSKPPAVDPQSQPPAQSSELILVPATPVEYVQTAHLNADEWKGPLTLEQYLEREAVLQSVDLTKDGRITGWILTSESLPMNPDGTRPIFASCESILVHAYVARAGNVEKAQAHGIASVYVRPEYRGRGYAGRMMAELGQKLEFWQQSNDLPNPFSVLYSDIGPKFYSRFGWRVFPSNHIRLTPRQQEDHGSARIPFPAVHDLSVSDLQDIPTVTYIEQHLQQMSTANPRIPHVAIRPDLEHFAWHFARDEFQSQVLGRDQPTVKGAIHQATGLALIWCRVYAAERKDWQLHILHTVIPPTIENSKTAQDAMAALLLRAQHEAHKWGMAAGVEVWDPSDLIVASAQRLRAEVQDKVEIIARDKDHLCSLRWAAASDDDLVWVASQKYAWC